MSLTRRSGEFGVARRLTLVDQAPLHLYPTTPHHHII
jgi:hypothetical protein